MNFSKRLSVVLSVLLAAVLLLVVGISPVAFAQNLNDAAYRTVSAANYSKWSAYLLASVPVNGTSLTVAPCYFTPNGPGKPFLPFSIYTPITIGGGSNFETVTPTAVGTPTYVSGVQGGCEVSVTVGALTYAHSAGKAVITPGDGGISEAAQAVRNGTVVLDGSFGSNTAIASIPVQNAFVSLRDDHIPGSPQWYRVGPSTLSLIAAGAAPTNTSITGSLTSGAYFTSYECGDMLGGLSLPASDSTQTGTVTGISEVGPAATTGCAGWIPMVTGAAGSAGTEIEVPVTSSVCKLSSFVLVKPMCAVGSPATITANPSSTAKEVAEGTAHTTFAWLPAGSSPFLSPNGAFQTSYGPFAAVATVASSGNADVAQFYVPAQTLNSIYKTVNVCVKATSTNVATAIPTWTLKATTQYGQSPVSLAVLVFPTQTGAVTTNECFKLQTNVVGSSGKFMASGDGKEAIQSSGVTVSAIDVNAAASSAIDLTSGLYFSLNLAAGTANITGVTVNSLTITPDSAN